MLDLLVWSKDRGCQLSCLLDSLKLNSNSLFKTTVIYTWSNEEFKKGYYKTIDLHNEVRFILENGFRNTTLKILEEMSDLVCCMVDDDVFYRRTELTEPIIRDILNHVPDSVFSFRLGTNITVGDNFTNQPVQQPNFQGMALDGKDIALLWKNENYHSPFHYSVSLDGVVFRKDWLLKRCQEIEFNTPNFLEGRLQKFNNEISHIISPVNSHLFSIPCNRVQAEFENRTTNQFTSEELNNLWLSDSILKLDIDENLINCTHMNLKYNIV